MLPTAEVKGQRAREPIFYNFQLELHVFELFKREVVCSTAIVSLRQNATDEDYLVGKLTLWLSRSGIGRHFLQRPMSRQKGYDTLLLLGAWVWIMTFTFFFYSPADTDRGSWERREHNKPCDYAEGPRKSYASEAAFNVGVYSGVLNYELWIFYFPTWNMIYN